jgi:protein-disulfide isomerase
MKSKFWRRLASFGVVAFLCVASVLTARGARKPFSPSAPDYRGRGPADAKVLMVEFSDFECPACRKAEPVLQQLMTLYDGRLRFVFKHYPLEKIHPWARAGAIAAECAGRQDRFWPYHDRLYDKQDDWTNEKSETLLTSYAKDLKLDVAAWQACRQDPSTAAAIEADKKDGDDAWVTATPTFFVNGRRFVGALQLRELGTIHIDKELKK